MVPQHHFSTVRNKLSDFTEHFPKTYVPVICSDKSSTARKLSLDVKSSGWASNQQPVTYCSRAARRNQRIETTRSAHGHTPGGRTFSRLSCKIIDTPTANGSPKWVTMATGHLFNPSCLGLPVVISTVCQWKLITRLNASHPWANYQLSGSCYIDHDNPPARKERAGGRWVHFQGVLKFLTTIHANSY